MNDPVLITDAMRARAADLVEIACQVFGASPLSPSRHPLLPGAGPATFMARIKRPDGDVDLRIIAYYYWQAFNAAKDWIIKHPAA